EVGDKFAQLLGGEVLALLLGQPVMMMAVVGLVVELDLAVAACRVVVLELRADRARLEHEQAHRFRVDRQLPFGIAARLQVYDSSLPPVPGRGAGAIVSQPQMSVDNGQEAS